MNTTIIDGYNLAHKHSQISPWLKKGDTEKTIRLLINWLLQLPNLKSRQIILALDGRKGYFNEQNYSANIKLFFSQRPQTADDIIRNYIRNAARPTEITVVSSDNEIIYTALDHGAKSIKSETFIRDHGKKSGTGKNSSPPNSEKYNPENIDVDYWMKQFGDD